jgi:hypothetical protein
MTTRHHVYDQIQLLLADGDWHDSRELERVTSFPAPWLRELRHDPRIEIRDDGEGVRLRSRSVARAAAAPPC